MAVNERKSGAANGSEERDPALDRLYREAAAESPPAHLDAAILAAARREVGARPRVLAQGLRRWHVPVSIAAVVIVSVSLVILVRDEERMELRRADTPEAAMQRRIDEATAPPRATPAEAPGKRAEEQAADSLLRSPVSGDDSRPARILGTTKPEARDRRESGPVAPLSAGVTATPEPAAELRLSRPAAPAPGVADEPARSAKADSVTEERVAAATPAPSQPQAARSAAEAPQAKPAPMAQGLLHFKDRPPIWQGFDKEPPGKWLARIEELRKEGRAADAAEMLSEFKRRFPGHPLPASLE